MFSEGEEMYLQGNQNFFREHHFCTCIQRLRVPEPRDLYSVCEAVSTEPGVTGSTDSSGFAEAKLGDEILDYRDLAALPKNKAIYNIDRPDMISYSPYISHSVGDRQSYSEGDQDDRSYKQCRTSSPSSTGSVSLGRYTPTSRSPQHYSRPGTCPPRFFYPV
ncbi:Actin-binding LIM protein 2 [Camelus dromedarius]|uniref:Actin-binding LIM protein 2 n=1 Tax=Camelus dromedarius TaxID=9838 RepID=A0A5N4EHE0_CAMDR|nr:Actin-binding LIM protein 2 [Camelus dromedarius]KAB1282923.1 Actin-binding LIM protein 2 [Camelus dromedarius]